MPVSYFYFLFIGFVIDTPGYPTQLTTECVEPEGYPTVWNYTIWLLGRWSNIDNIGRCIDPNLCYNDPPELPNDFTVAWNYTSGGKAQLGMSVKYSCTGKSEF